MDYKDSGDVFEFVLLFVLSLVVLAILIISLNGNKFLVL